MSKRSTKVRRHFRFPIRWPVRYHWEGMRGEGVLYNLSLSGGRIVGDVPVSVGRSLVVRFSLPGEAESFQFDQATVRWVKGLEFGMDLGPRSPDKAERFTRILAVFAENHHGSKE